METVNIKVQHTSMQYSDDDAQHVHDLRAIFHRGQTHQVWAMLGTEVTGSTFHKELLQQADQHNFTVAASPYGEWVALNREILNNFKSGYEGPFIPGTHGVGAAHGGHAPRGIQWAQGESKKYNLNKLTFGAAHFLTHRSIRVSGSNAPLQAGVGQFGQRFGKGGGKVFIGIDTNIVDTADRDVLAGLAPFTSMADELGEYPATRGQDKDHGSPIDSIFSYDEDKFVTAKSYRVLDDSDISLYTDHFLLEGVFSVKYRNAHG